MPQQTVTDTENTKANRISVKNVRPEGIHHIEQRQQSAVVNIRVRDQTFLFDAVKFGNNASDHRQHFFLVAGIARINEQIIAAALDDRGIAAAGRFDQRHRSVIGNRMHSDTRREVFAA